MKFIDLHCDTMLRLFEGQEGLWQNERGVDIQKLRDGDSLAQFFALFVNMDLTDNPLERCLAMLDYFHSELEKNKEHISLATNYAEIVGNQAAGKLSAFLAIEEGGVLKGQLSNMRNFYRLGVRIITLTWNYPNEIGFPNAGGLHTDKGLTAFGREVK